MSEHPIDTSAPRQPHTVQSRTGTRAADTRKITAQVAVEAIVNLYGDGYELETIRAVMEEGTLMGVAPLYLDMLRPYTQPEED